MARIRLVDREGASPEVLEIFDGKLRGKPKNSQKALAHRPEILTTFLDFFSAVGRGMDRRLYELVYIRVSMLNMADYCRSHHVLSSRKAGLTDADLQGLNDSSARSFTDRERTALAFAEKLTTSPGLVDDADFATLRRYFDDGEILELDMVVALANLTNRLTGPMGLDFEFPDKLA